MSTCVFSFSTFKGQSDGDIKDGDDLSLALVDIDISGH